MKKKICLLTIVAALAMISGCNVKQERNSNNSSNEESSSESTSSSSSSYTPTKNEPNEENPDAKVTTVSTVISEKNSKRLYRLTGTVQCILNSTYGNFDLVDSTGYIYVYGCSKTNKCISGSKDNYTFSSASGFSSMDIKPGDEITVEGLYEYYSGNGGVHEFKCYVTKIVRNNQYDMSAKSYTTAEPTNQAGDYYDSITSDLSGNNLAKQLHSLMDTTHTYFTTYSSLNNHFKSSDAHPNGNVKCFYSGQKTNSYNREHVWPVSLSNNLFDRDNPTYGAADLHHVRPTISQYNSARSNTAFGPVFGNKNAFGKISYSGGGTDYYTQNIFEPADSIKGDVARIIMYVLIHYSSTYGSEKDYYGSLNLTKVIAPWNETECKNLLRKWNAEDPVSQDEITRNNYAYSIQKNRNPFIDHPTYADRIWG